MPRKTAGKAPRKTRAAPAAPPAEGKEKRRPSRGGPGAPSRNPPSATPGDFVIAGVGASAGGLEALQKFCNVLPAASGIGVVVVQHMDPRGSMLTEILGKTAGIPVVEAADRMAVRPDRIHVIPPNANMTVSGGYLRVVRSPPRRGTNMPIDLFLLSLAEEAKERAVGVILSGTGSDGSRGVRAIKDEGGIVFAQDDCSAKYPGMPGSAIRTGCVDFVLPPDRIAREIVRIGSHPLVGPMARKEREEEHASGPKAENERIFPLLLEATGVDFSQYRQATLRRRIRRRMVVRKVETIPAYVKLLAGEPGERDALSRDFLISVTSFFRDPGAFDALKRNVLPILLKKRPDAAPIRVWVPGCSTGEEVFTLAICLLETAKACGLSRSFQIFGTDVNDASIETARNGSYPEGIAADVPAGSLQHFFVGTGNGYQVGKQIRELCVFARHDLVRDPPFSRMDLLSCRNVLIYLQPAAQKKIVPMFHYALRPEGYLFLGSSESIGAYPELFDPVDRKNKIYVRKNAAIRPYRIIGQAHREKEAREQGQPAQAAFWSVDAVRKEADRIVLRQYGPPGVLVDEELRILQFRGEAGPYLSPPPGPASFDLLKMARGGIASTLGKVVGQARAEGRAVIREGVTARIGGRKIELAVEAIPVRPPPGGPLHFMVLFREASSGEGPGPAEHTAGAEPGRAGQEGPEWKHVEGLEREVAETREYLESVVDEHRATADELRSAIEELQSSNEELTTVNEELTNRNGELALASNDLHNFLGSADIPIVMVGKELRIRRFTSSAEKLLNLIPADVGRPIADVNLNLSIAALDRKVLDVMRSLSVRSLEVQDRSGRWLQMKIRPYRTVDDKIDGAVLSFSDIDPLKRSLEVAEALSRYLQAILDTVREPLIVLDGGLSVLSANRAFYDTFRTSERETAGCLVYELGNGQWNIPRLRTLLEEILPGNKQFQEFEVDHEFPWIGRRRLMLNARRLEGEGGRTDRILLAIEDRTDRHRS